MLRHGDRLGPIPRPRKEPPTCPSTSSNGSASAPPTAGGRARPRDTEVLCRRVLDTYDFRPMRGVQRTESGMPPAEVDQGSRIRSPMGPAPSKRPVREGAAGWRNRVALGRVLEVREETVVVPRWWPDRGAATRQRSPGARDGVGPSEAPMTGHRPTACPHATQSMGALLDFSQVHLRETEVLLERHPEGRRCGDTGPLRGVGVGRSASRTGT
jgi:hypothetical protein